MQQKQRVPDQFHTNPFPEIGRAAWSNALNIGIQAVQAGKPTNEAIDAAIEYIRKNAVSSFDGYKARRTLREQIDEAMAASEMVKPAEAATPIQKPTETKELDSSDNTRVQFWLNWKPFVAGLLFGLLLGWGVSCLHGPRYRIERFGSSNRFVVRTDTWTGKSWVLRDRDVFPNDSKPEWKPVEEQK